MELGKFSIAAPLLLAAAIAPALHAQPSGTTVKSPAAGHEQKEDLAAFEKSMDMGDVIALFREQQQEIAAQRKLLEDQSRKIETLTRELASLQAAQAQPKPDVEADTARELAAQRQMLQHQSRQITALTQELDTVRAAPSTNKVSTQIAQSPTKADEISPAASAPSAKKPATAAEKATATGNAVAQAQADDPSRDVLKDFKGAWRLPGTDAALAIGGFVKTDVVYNFDPLQIKDRFIVGSIPVGITETTGDEAQSSVTADQSRLNFDLRQPTSFGIMRAFIEGDFAGSGETFRLRHAFGQWKRMLAGKTWSTFMDPGASPEEIDFEGLNGRINVRQAQVRFMPTFGEEYELQLALEDPNPQITNGSGVTRTPDVVLAGRFQPYGRVHTKLAMIFREIRGQSDNNAVSKEFAWGVSLSGSVSTPQLDKRDKALFQLSYGDGIGRYVNDLSSIGNYDGIFEPGTDDLQLFTVTAGYVSWQHWWPINELRSNFTFGAVEVDNPGFLDDEAYRQTLRFSSNLIWSPIPRIDLGAEYLWGQRKNVNGDTGSATQLQFAVKYRF
tara:strand:- start:10117 stop:11790 length:1674 start_codon:yes stop_codon:yes gene_type:complete